MDLVAACAFGLEAVVKRELEALDLSATIGNPGRVHFQGSLETIGRANLWLRTADRVLIQVSQFPAADFDVLFETTRDLNWGKIIPANARFPVTGRSIKSTLSSVPACQRAVKRAIVDAMRRDHGQTVLPEDGPEYKVDIAVLKDVATLTIDTTGRSLHRRGYRTLISQAPLKETLAAAMVMLSFWKRDRPLIDPFCGSGTIPIEAAMIGRNMAPGRTREFAFHHWPAFPKELWQDLRADALANQLDSLEERILGSDHAHWVLKAARENAERAGVSNDIHFQEGSFDSLTSKRRFGCLITNPPYGERIGEDWELDELYGSIPDVLRKLPTWSHYFLTAYPGFESILGRPADRRRKLYNGRIECTYFQFHGPKPVVDPNPLESGSEVTSESHDGETMEVVAQKTTTSQKTARSKWPNAEETSTPKSEPATESDPATDSEPETESDLGTERTSPTGKSRPRSVSKPYVHADGAAAFGELDQKATEQAELFAVRLRKRAKHLRRWPTRRGITCFRIYERDIPEIPLVVDRYGNYLHITEYERPHDRDPAQHGNWLDRMAETAAKALEVPSKHVFLKRRSRQRGNTQYGKVAETGNRIEVEEGGLKFLVNLSDYVDTGLFLDHRVARQRVREEAHGKNFLNLFAYTGAFTVYAAAGGAAKTTSVDLSQRYLDWANENMRINGFTGPQHRFLASDVGDFLRGYPTRESFDLVVVDPPTFSNSKRTDYDWNVQHHAVPMLNDLLPLVKRGGVIYFSCNFRRFKFDSSALSVSEVHEISKQTVPEDFRNRRIHRCWRMVR
ncbi:MAG: bifunctional 23S rRNA (guanine(2069)-N(7))-methyltransferase RlmK/23S rRNA (guanine(2445)-N(2))-methyltransferase RlmL [Planctomycetota bacterium]|nr:bifunctional 23S rRNA (guanine(2069)-N(7))-methyltransferase RlmK/23S rRNA (guanine(2445)-N(2))-methyltransferase RlmL [Planctomycetota bacterium]